MKAIPAIHAMKRELGLEEEDYRSLLERITGKASLRLMTSTELNSVVVEMKAKGAGARKRLDGDFGPKLQALWISGWNLGVVRNRDDAALLDFVRTQTKVDHTRFVRDANDGRKVVEAIKKWLERDAGVDWSEFPDPQDCVLAAQLRLLGESRDSVSLSAHGVTSEAGRAAVQAIGKVALMQILGERIRAGKAGA